MCYVVQKLQNMGQNCVKISFHHRGTYSLDHLQAVTLLMWIACSHLFAKPLDLEHVNPMVHKLIKSFSVCIPFSDLKTKTILFANKD